MYCAPGMLQKAQKLFADLQTSEESDLLREIQGVPTKKDSVLQRFLWWLCWITGFGKLPESRAEARKRVVSFVSLLIERDADCVVAAGPYILQILLRELQRRGFSIRRNSSGSIRPGERILVTEKSAHCGGCQHNCLLSNPGCGVGHDKAKRGY